MLEQELSKIIRSVFRILVVYMRSQDRDGSKPATIGSDSVWMKSASGSANGRRIKSITDGKHCDVGSVLHVATILRPMNLNAIVVGGAGREVAAGMLFSKASGTWRFGKLRAAVNPLDSTGKVDPHFHGSVHPPLVRQQNQAH
jgi:hypothetical protein